jgi:translation initiation factor 4B
MDLQDFLKSNAFTQSSSNAFNFTSNNIDLSKINEVPKAAPKAHDLNDFLTGKASSLDPSAEKTINSKKTYVEFPVPDYPPFMATFCNFPPDITEEGVKNWFEDGIQNPGCVLNLNMPKNMDNTYKRRGFVEFKSKSDLEKALKLSSSFLNSNKLYVDVADPNTRINSNGRSGGYGGRYASGLTMNWSKGSGAVPQQNDSYTSAQPVDWSKKGANQPERGVPASAIDWSQKGQNFREPRQEAPSATSFDWAKKGQNIREPRQEGPSAASLDWAKKGQNIREPRQEAPSATSFDWAKKGQNIREPRQEAPSAASMDWALKGSNKQREQLKPKTVSPTSFDWSKKGAFVDEPRSQRNSKNNENKEAKSSTKTLGFDKLSLDEE